MDDRELSRRHFLRVAGLSGSAVVGTPALGMVAAACAPSAASLTPAGGASPAPQAQGKAQWEEDWEKLIDAAKKEGKVVVMTLAGEGYRKQAAEFEAAFPGIVAEHSGMFARDWAPRVLQERKAGLYAWDVAGPPTITAFGSLFPENVFDPIRPVIFRPDVLGDQNWQGGFEFGFADTDKKWVFGYSWNLEGGYYVNTNLVKEGEIKGFKDLLDAKWKGKIAIADPRTGGASATPLAVAVLKHGEGAIKQFFEEQAPVLFREPRQGAEQVVRGQVAVAIGTTEPVMTEFRTQGLTNMRRLFPDDFSFLFQDVVWLMNRAPHPNAAKLYINWLLSKQGQEAYAKNVAQNSRRKDVTPVDQSTLPPEGADKRFQDMLRQDRYPESERIRELTRQLLK